LPPRSPAPRHAPDSPNDRRAADGIVLNLDDDADFEPQF
jgi:hypothetical protein